MIRVLKKICLILLIILQSVFFTPACVQAAVVVFDRVTTVGTSVYLKVLTKGRIFAAGGQRVTFYLENRQLGKTLTGGDGYGFLKVTPASSGMQEIEVRSDKEKGNGHLLVLDRDEKVIVIEIEGPLKTSLYSESIRSESRKAVTALSRSYKIIYLSRLFGLTISKTWLQNEELPISAVLPWRGEDTLEELKENGVNLWAIIGSAALISTSSEYFEKSYTFEESETGTMLENWAEVEDLLLKQEKK